VLAAGAVGVVAAEYLFRTRGHPYGLNTQKPTWLLVEAAVALVALAYAWRTQDRLRLVPLLALALGFHLLWLGLHVHLRVPGDADTHVYGVEGSSLLDGDYPRSEYPPGAVLLFALEAWLHRPVHTANGFVMVPFQLAIVGSVWSLRTRFSGWLAAVVALWPMSAYYWELRFDLAPTAFLAAGLALALHRRFGWAGLALGLGTAVKWSPTLAFASLAVWCLAAGLRRAAARLSVAFAAGLLAVYLPFLVWTPEDLGVAYSGQSSRPFTGASVWYLPFHLLGQTEPLAKSYGYAGAPRWANAVAVAIQIVLVAATLLIAVGLRRSLRSAVAAAAAVPVVFFLTNKIFSPQFLVLLLAAWAIAIAVVAESRREQAALAALAVAATFANVFVGQFVLWDHDRTWLACSVAMFVAACAVTGFVLGRARRQALEPA
jgi:hypothetical protein